VGRAPIDEDAIRLLEEYNPDVQFDWTRILKSPAPPQQQGRREDRRERRERRERPRTSGASEAPSARAAAELTNATTEYAEPADVSAAAEVANHLSELDELETGDPQLETGDRQLDTGDRQLETSSRELETSNPQLEADVDSRYARIGAEGLARLRARYAEVMARIAQRPLEESQREELRAKAERLNPDAWVTADEVAAALEQYETVFEQLRAVVGRHQGRRRRRR
jgi:hypothetical protein